MAPVSEADGIKHFGDAGMDDSLRLHSSLAPDGEYRSYSDEGILIANMRQLALVGTGAPVTTTDLDADEVGMGDAIKDADGKPVRYSLDASYVLGTDIVLDGTHPWQLPDGFTGSFSAPSEEDDADGLSARLYDATSDTIYVQNALQLATLVATNRDSLPLMSGDSKGKMFGTGHVVTDENGETVYYSNAHTYVLSVTFDPSDDTPEVLNEALDIVDGEDAEKDTQKDDQEALDDAKAEEKVPDDEASDEPVRLAGNRQLASQSRSGAAQVEGRDYVGQVTATIDGVTYILVGDRQQLDAINSDATTRTQVCQPVYKVSEGVVEVWRSSAHLTHDWIWLSDFNETRELTNGNGYGTTPTEVMASYQALLDNPELVYPGDADLVGNFEQSPLYDVDSSGYHQLGSSTSNTPLGSPSNADSTRDSYFTTGASGPDISTVPIVASNPTAGNLRYTKDGNYIVFRDIDMTKGDASQVSYGTLANGDWKPLMFTGNMYGAKAVSPSDTGTLGQEMQILLAGRSLDLTTQRPTLSNFNVTPKVRDQLGTRRLDLNVNSGVGFFGTITGKFNSSAVITEPAAVVNLRIENGTVTNECLQGQIDTSVVSGLLSGLGWVLGGTLDLLLKALTGKSNFTVQDMLTSLLNAREKDPTSLATGAFAGRILSDTTVRDCEATSVAVSSVTTDFETGGITTGNKSKIVGTGGFAGHVEGETRYEGLSGLLGGLVTVLSGVLNVIPGLGLGDLIDILLDNALPVGNLIPTSYARPEIQGCSVISGTLSTGSGKCAVGGFAGSACGAYISDCLIDDSTMTINAKSFSGGFVGIARDAMIKGTLSGLGIDALEALHPQSELIRCTISDSAMTIMGQDYVGGFAGALANSYVINGTVTNSPTVVTATGDYVGGCAGYAHLGTLFGFSDYLVEDASLLSTLTGLVSQLVGNGSDQALLDIAGVAPSAVMGWQSDSSLIVSSQGAFVGGIVGRGNGMTIAPSYPDDLRTLAKYDDKRNDEWAIGLPISSSEGRETEVSHLVSVSAGGSTTNSAYEDASFAGGIAGYLTSANVGGLLGSTVGIGQFLGFAVHGVTVSGSEDSGYSVTGSQDYAGGGVGWAVGGDLCDVSSENVSSVTARNHAGGFVGATGPGDLVNGEGLDVSLLGISLISIDNLLSLVSGVRTTYQRADVAGISSGMAVISTGMRSAGDVTTYVAGGWAAEANSVRVVDCQSSNIMSVTANMADGIAGGYVGASSAGGLAGVAGNTSTLNALQIGQLVDAVPYLVPSYDGCSATFVDAGFVAADSAGGFTGDFQSGKVNTYAIDDINPIYDDDEDGYVYSDSHASGYAHGTDSEPWSVYNICHIRGGTYAGGWGGNVYSGALASAGSGLSLLGGLSNISISAQDLLGVAGVYVPIVKYAGVRTRSETQSGFSVLAAHDAGTGGEPAQEGYAGGFIGYASGVQISYCDVDRLRRGTPDEPTSLTAEDIVAYRRIGVYPSALESADGSSYMAYDPEEHAIPYSVAGARYAGGYVGHMDVGSAASLGGGLQLLGNSLSLTNVLDALSVVVSTIEYSDVHGAPGGFSVLASSHVTLGDGEYDERGIGHAGGYAGKISGGHIQNSNVDNFAYVIGEVSAGGYVGEMEPGDVAHVLDNGSLSLLGQVNNLASLVQDFVPTIRNSETTCIPCGGAVRAQTPSDTTAQMGSAVRGMAGGYVGHCKGGHIWGMSDDTWKKENDGIDAFGNQTNLDTVGHYLGNQKDCAAIRIRSVYGAEYAGGYCGLMECGSTAQTGGLNLLGGLLSADNLLGALQVVYPTIRHGVTYGPLEQVSETTWDAWKQYVGAYGGFASELVNAEYSDLGDYIYGYHVVAGRHTYDGYATAALSGCAGGFVGAMHSGVITSSRGEDAKVVLAMRATGGFAGEMQTKGLAEFGSVNILGDALNLNLGNLVSLANVFVPAVSTSGTTGYQNGLRVGATGVPSDSDGNGCAGGFVGGAYGGQIGISDDESPDGTGHDKGTWIRNLKDVNGTNAIGGFVGIASAASVLTADTENASSGLLQKILDKLVSTPTKLVNLLQATMTTIKFAEVRSVEGSEWGIVVDGKWNDDGTNRYAYHAGGFAGSLEATVIGERSNEDDLISVTGLRGVVGGHYAGGFFGLADVGSVAQVGGSSGTGASTSILNLIQAGNVSILDMFRTYIYRASVTGVADGIRIYAHDKSYTGIMHTWTPTGAAGGFGGGLMNGTVEGSSVSDLNYVEAPSFAGGFVGHAGRNGGVGVDEAKVTNDALVGQILASLGLNNLGANAQVLNIVGSTLDRCAATGFDDGFITRATSQQSAIPDVVDPADLMGACSGGFIGYGDITQIDDCDVTRYKLSSSPQVAGGFIGRSSVAYIADVDASSNLTEKVVEIVNLLIRALYLSEAERLDLLNLDGGVLGLKLLSDGDLLYVNLLGLKIGVSLVKDDPEYDGQSDSAIITIGSSTIKLPCDQNGLANGATPDVNVSLIEGNRTAVKNSSVTGIDIGYDVFGGGATQNTNGGSTLGYAGGFIGYNDNGFLSHDTATLCDVVRGTDAKVGPFAGGSEAATRSLDYLEGTDNVFKIYRAHDERVNRAETASGTKFADRQTDGSTATTYNRYDVTHREVISQNSDLEEAMQQGTNIGIGIGAYYPTMSVLMLNTPVNENGKGDTVEPDDLKDPCDEEFELTINKVWNDTGNVLGTRPESISVYVSQIDAGATPPGALIEAGPPQAGESIASTWHLTLTSYDEGGHTTAWKTRLPSLPIARMEGTGPDEQVMYWKYRVYEVSVPGYETAYELSSQTASFTIRNVYNESLMPYLGGDGNHDILEILIPLLGLLLLWMTVRDVKKYRKRRLESREGRRPG